MSQLELPPRLCQGCNEWHPATTTCSSGWKPWDGGPVIVTRDLAVKCRCRTEGGYQARVVSPVLDPTTLNMAAAVAQARHESSWGRDRDELYEKDADADFQVHLIGAIGEAAYALTFGVPWPMGVDTYNREPDFPPDIDVKCSWKPGTPLKVRDSSRDGWRYVSAARQEDGSVVFQGWVWGAQAKKWPKTNPGGWKPVHEVPVAALHRFPLDARHA